MTDKRTQINTEPGLGPVEPMGPVTLRALSAVDESEVIGRTAPVYYEPQPLVALSDHKTLELQTVKLAEDIDPRKLATELRLSKPNEQAPPPDSPRSSETAVTSSHRPLSLGHRRWRAPLLWLALLMMLLVLARIVTRPPPVSAGASRPRAAARTVMNDRPPLLALPATGPSMVSDAPTTFAADSFESQPRASAPPVAHAASHPPAHAAARPPQPAARVDPPAVTPSAASSSSKPKRAIY